MTAELLHWTGVTDGDDTTDVDTGQWTSSQDPITGEIRNVWEPTEITPPGGGTPVPQTIPVLARGVISQGVYASGSGERFGATYDNFEVVRLWTLPNVVISKRDRVTNIKDAAGHILFKDEENGDIPTIFNVQGITPIFDGFNNLKQQYILLERAPA